VEAGETPEQCLYRELREEFGVETRVGEFIAESRFHYKEKSIRLLAYRVEYISGDFLLNAHEEIRWITKEEFDRYEMAEADVPIVKMLRE
jgi:8-oxo-dGTP diphosphatase